MIRVPPKDGSGNNLSASKAVVPKGYTTASLGACGYSWNVIKYNPNQSKPTSSIGISTKIIIVITPATATATTLNEMSIITNERIVETMKTATMWLRMNTRHRAQQQQQ